MLYLTISCLLTFVLCLLSSLFVLWHKPRKKINFIWAAIGVAVSFWALGYMFTIRATGYSQALFWSRLHNYFAVFIPMFFLHFTYLFTNKKSILIKYSYIITALFLSTIIIFPNLFIPGVQSPKPFNYYDSPGILFGIFFIHYSILSSIGLIQLIKGYLSAEESKKMQYRIILTAVSIGLLGGATCFPMVYGLNIFPYGAPSSIIYICLITYAITKHNILDIKVVITKTGATAIALIPALFTFFIIHYNTNNTSYYTTLTLMNFLFWAFIFTKFQRYLQTYVEKKFLKGRYDVNEVMKNISGLLVLAQDRWMVFTSIANEFKDSLEIKDVHILYPLDEFNRENEAYHFFPSDQESPGLILLSDSKFVTYFNKLNTVVKWVDIPTDVREDISDYHFHKFALVLPIHSLRRFQGVIVLDRKLSEDPFTDNDIMFLEAIMNQIIVVFERILQQEKLKFANEKMGLLNEELSTLNIKLKETVADEIQKKELLLEEAQVLSRQAALANLTKGIAHEIKNPINNMKMNVSSIRDNIVQQRYFDERNIEDNNTWQGIVSRQWITSLCSTAQQGAGLWTLLLERGYITEKGRITDGFKPNRLDFEFVLPDEYKSIVALVETYLRHTLVKWNYWTMADNLENEFDRITKITSSMLQYGETGKGITNSAFSEIMSFGESNLLWEELVSNGYLNKAGFITPKFDPAVSGFSLTISPVFKTYESAIIGIIVNNPFAMKKSIDINTLINEVAALCNGRFSKDFIRYTANLGTIPNILGSKDALKQCLINVFDNSVDAMIGKDKNNRQLTLSTTESEFKNSDHETVVGICIQIEDTGSGISKENIDKIRTPFFTTKSKTGGRNSGLGMPFVYQTLEGHGGRVVVTSDAGCGTRIRLYFPVI